MKKVLLGVFIFLSAVSAHAQATVNVQMQMGPAKWWQPLPVPHRTADHAYWISTAASVLAMVADVENTKYALRDPRLQERDPLLGAHPSRARMYGIMVPITGGMAAFSYYYKRQDDALAASGYPPHRFVKWWLPNALNTVGHVTGVLFTVAETRR